MPLYETPEDRTRESEFRVRLMMALGRHIQGMPKKHPVDFEAYEATLTGRRLCAVGEIKYRKHTHGFFQEGLKIDKRKIDDGIQYGDDRRVPYLLCVNFAGVDFFAMISKEQAADYETSEFQRSQMRDPYDADLVYHIPYTEFSQL